MTTAAGRDPLITFLMVQRQVRGLTQRQVAERAGLSRTTVMEMESGRITVMLSTPRAYARGIGFEFNPSHLTPLATETLVVCHPVPGPRVSVRFTGDNHAEITSFCGPALIEWGAIDGLAHVTGMDGVEIVDVGSWIHRAPGEDTHTVAVTKARRHAAEYLAEEL